jgi:hypothetical protein
VRSPDETSDRAVRHGSLLRTGKSRGHSTRHVPAKKSKLYLSVFTSVEKRRGSSSVGCVTGVRSLTLPHLPTASASGSIGRPITATPLLTYLDAPRSHRWSPLRKFPSLSLRVQPWISYAARGACLDRWVSVVQPSSISDKP